MDIETLEELLQDILPPGFHFGTDKKGQIIVYTQLAHSDDDEELVTFDEDEDDDADFDSDTDSLSVLDGEDDDD